MIVFLSLGQIEIYCIFIENNGSKSCVYRKLFVYLHSIKELNNIIIHPQKDVIMFALFFLYVLIIAVAVFVLKLILWILLIPILWIYFSIADAIGRKKKVARQRK